MSTMNIDGALRCAVFFCAAAPATNRRSRPSLFIAGATHAPAADPATASRLQ
jgi:hypothetical protein